MLPLHPRALRYYREAGIADEQEARALAGQMNDELAKQTMLLPHPKERN